MEPIKIKLDDKPNLAQLYISDAKSFRMVLSTMLAMAERAADQNRENRIPWYQLPFLVNNKLDFPMLVEAMFEAIFEVQGLHPENFTVMGADLHPLAVLKKDSKPKDDEDYSSWRRHFNLPEDAEVTKDTIVDILRSVLYYTRFIPVKEFGQAHLSRQLEVHKADPELALEKLPFVPALNYQRDHFKPLQIGRFWKDIGAFYGGVLPEDHDSYDCPACKTHKLERIGNYLVCPGCNIGFKEGANENE